MLSPVTWTNRPVKDDLAAATAKEINSRINSTMRSMLVNEREEWCPKMEGRVQVVGRAQE